MKKKGVIKARMVKEKDGSLLVSLEDKASIEQNSEWMLVYSHEGQHASGKRKYVEALRSCDFFNQTEEESSLVQEIESIYKNVDVLWVNEYRQKICNLISRIVISRVIPVIQDDAVIANLKAMSDAKVEKLYRSITSILP